LDLPWWRAAASARCASPPRAPVTSESFGTALWSGGSCQENKRILVKIHPQGKKDSTSGQRNESDPRPKYLCEPVRRPRKIETRVKSGGLWRRFCRMETSFLIFLTLVSNYNDQTPRILHNHLRVTLTPALPINNERNYQELKRREREKERHTHTTDSETERKRERKRKKSHVIHRSVTTNSRPNSLSVKIQSDITRIYAERWGPPRSRGRGERERGGWGERKRVIHIHHQRLFTCRETKYFLGWRLLSGQCTCGVTH